MNYQQQIDSLKAEIAPVFTLIADKVDALGDWHDPWETVTGTDAEYRHDSYALWGIELGPWRCTEHTPDLIRMEFPSIPALTRFPHHLHDCTEVLNVRSGRIMGEHRGPEKAGRWVAFIIEPGDAYTIPKSHAHHVVWAADTFMVMELRR